MILSEKDIASAMKAAYKGCGYTVYMVDDGILIYTESWCCMAAKKTDLKKVLSILVEHTGTIPDRGTAWNISKDNGIQAELAESAQAMLDTVLSVEHGKAVTRTMVRLEDARIYQDSDLKVYAVAEADLKLIDEANIQTLLAYKNYMRTADEESRVAVWYSSGSINNTLTSDIMAGLSTIQLTAI